MFEEAVTFVSRLSSQTSDMLNIGRLKSEAVAHRTLKNGLAQKKLPTRAEVYGLLATLPESRHKDRIREAIWKLNTKKLVFWVTVGVLIAGIVGTGIFYVVDELL